MKLYNKGGRALILDSKDVLEGGRYLEHDKKKEKCYFDPSTNIEVSEDCGNKLVGMYPAMLMQTDKSNVAPAKKKKVVKKVAKKVVKKVTKTKKR